MQPYDGFSDHGEVEGANSMNTQNVWIKRSEREPQPDEFPVLAGYYLGGHDKWNEYRCGVGQQLGSATHWRSIKCDPPARELTQRERDEATIGNIVVSYRYSSPTRQVAEAIYAERREVCALLNQLWAHDWGAKSGLSPVRELRVRLDEQGQGK